MMYVEESYRDQGYGKKFLNYILTYIRAVYPNTKKIILSPLPLDNKGLVLVDLIEFYKKFGFKVCEKHPIDKPYMMEMVICK